MSMGVIVTIWNHFQSPSQCCLKVATEGIRWELTVASWHPKVSMIIMTMINGDPEYLCKTYS